ncbi:MAG TPA: class II aldolase/adducin family protein [Solirubrobacteraceae bacterium]|nr:class II aldolase/adducin family protein [Solirubrobacteraceae bacterium]
MLERERERVAVAARRLADAGLVIGTAGNLSMRTSELVAITPTGGVLAALSAEQVSVVDLDGRQRDGELEPTSELDLHLGLYHRHDAGAVVHTHAPYATALACVLDELPIVHYSLLDLGGPVRVAGYATFGTEELAEQTLAALADRSAALMANHGTIAHGADVEQAVERTLLLEWGCELYWRAAMIGKPRVLDDDQCQAVLSAKRERGYGAVKPRERTPR